MKVITSSSSRWVFYGNFNDGRRSSLDHLPRKAEVRFPGRRRVSDSPFLHHVVSLAPNAPSYLSCSSSPSNSEANLDTGETRIEELDGSRTARVRFKLQKECSFGEQFLVVGGVPILGLWDPAHAVPMDWSVGHVWVVEMDLPIGKTIQYKFLLRHPNGNVFWQPGPDRIFQTLESKNVVTVIEDWHNPGLRSIVEEDSTHVQDEEHISEPELVVAEQNVTHSHEESATDKPRMENQMEPIVQENTTRSQENPLENDKANGTLNQGCLEEAPAQTRSMLVEESTFGSSNETLAVEGQVSYEGSLVLVPGLTPMSTQTAEEQPTVTDVNSNSIEIPIHALRLTPSLAESTKFAAPDYFKSTSATSAPTGADEWRDHDVLKDKPLVNLDEANGDKVANGVSHGCSGKPPVQNPTQQKKIGSNSDMLIGKGWVSYVGDPVLVPGLSPVLTKSAEEPTVKDETRKYENCVSIEAPIQPPGSTPSLVQSAELATPDCSYKKNPSTTDVPTGGDGFQDHDAGENPGMGARHERESDHLPAASKELGNSDPLDDDIVWNDIRWGRGALQKILGNIHWGRGALQKILGNIWDSFNNT